MHVFITLYLLLCLWTAASSTHASVEAPEAPAAPAAPAAATTASAPPPAPAGICTSHQDKTYHGLLVNCSYRSLTSLPQNLPTNTTTLLLSGNKIQNVPDNSFLKLPWLMKLDMSNNGYIIFDKNSFEGLTNLEVLLLNYAEGLDGTNGTLRDYPDASLSKLTALKVLYINGLQNDFGPGFVKLKSLRNLSLSAGYCNIGRLRNTTFINIPFVETLNISNCKIVDTELYTLSPLKNIHTLDVSFNRDLGFRNVSKAVYGLRNSQIKVLKLNSLYPVFGSCSMILLQDLIHLNETNLTHLHIDDNGITAFGPKTLASMPHTLEYLSARENRFAYGSYMFDLINMTSLKFLDISLMNAWRKVPVVEEQGILRDPQIPLPPNLETFVADKCYITGVFSKCTLLKNKLRKIIFSHNLLKAVNGPINGIENIEHFDFSHNQLEYLQYYFFPVNNSATYLNLSHNYLGKQIEADTDGGMLNYLDNIKFMDLSNNLLDFLPGNFCQGLNMVETLNFNGNYLERFGVNITHLTKLKWLNLSNNKLKRLSGNLLKQLEGLYNVTVNLHGNPLLCTCQELYFLKWIKKNQQQVYNVPDMKCELTNGTNIYLNNLDSIINYLETECKNSNGMEVLTDAVVIICCVLFILCIISFALAYRHRWKIRYFYHIARRRYWRSHNYANCEDEYIYDVFVSYAEKDRNIVIQEMIPEVENKAGLKMCVHHRDFLPGDVISASIVNAIDRSRKTLIVLSPAFLKSDWCVYEFEIALQSRVSRRQNNLLILLYQHVPVQDLPRDMAVLLSTNCYLEYNPDVYGREAFWQNLVEAVKTLQPMD